MMLDVRVHHSPARDEADLIAGKRSTQLNMTVSHLGDFPHNETMKNLDVLVHHTPVNDRAGPTTGKEWTHQT